MKTPSKQSMEKAAQAWCTEETKHLVMIPELAKAFANILDKQNFQAKPWEKYSSSPNEL